MNIKHVAVGYGSYSPVRGCGPLRETREEAECDVESDARLVAVNAEGYCYYLGAEGAELLWVRGPKGGVVRYVRAADARGGAAEPEQVAPRLRDLMLMFADTTDQDADDPDLDLDSLL